MSKLEIEVIEKGVELSNDDLFQVLGGAGGCGCRCKDNYASNCPANSTPGSDTDTPET